MFKYSILLASSLMLFSGCGGGGNASDSDNASLETLGTQNNTASIQYSLQRAGYVNASDIVELSTNTIAFTYMDGNEKHFVVYDKLNGKTLSNIPGFKGDSVISNDASSVIYDNGTKVNVDNYTHAKVETEPIYNSNTTDKTPKEKINDQLPSGQYVSQFVYSPQRQGAAVLVKSSGNTLVGLYLYGLEGSSPVRENAMYLPDDEGLSITDISFPESGKVTFIVHSMGWKYYYTYNQGTKKLTETNRVNPNGDSSSSNNTQTMSGEDAIRAQIETDYRAVEAFIYTSDNHSDAAVVISYVGGDGAKDFVLYEIPQNGTPYANYTVKPPEGSQAEWTSITNLRRIGGGKITFTGRSRDNNGYQIRNFTYYYLQHRYENSYSSNDNTQSGEDRIRAEFLNDGNDFTNVEDFAYSSDNHSDAAVAVTYPHSVRLFLYDIPQNGAPRRVFTVNPPSSGDEWTNISNLQRIGNGQITFTGNSKADGTRNYTYDYLRHYYVNNNN